MILNGKAKDLFWDWVYDNYPKNLISENCGYSYGMFERDLEQITNILPDFMVNALIIEWFDSVGIYISISKMELLNGFSYTILKENYSYGAKDKSRQEATTKAIEKSNEIFNKL